MQISQIEAFVQIASLGSLTRAAEALCITQPTVTERLQGLQREVGRPLFVRTQHGVALTKAGSTLLPYAKRILKNSSEAKAAIANLDTDTQSDLSLGAAFFTGVYLLPLLLRGFSNAYPDVRVSVCGGHSEEVLAMVLRDEVEIGLIRNIDDRDVETVKLMDDEMLLVVGRDHPFSHLSTVAMEQIAGEGIIAHGPGTDIWRLVNQLFLNADLSLRVKAQADSLETTIGMVKKGLGVTFLTRAAVQAEIEAGGLKSVAVANSTLPVCSVVAIRRKASVLSERAQAFLRNMRHNVLSSTPRALVSAR